MYERNDSLIKISRRSFLTTAAAAGGVLVSQTGFASSLALAGLEQPLAPQRIAHPEDFLRWSWRGFSSSAGARLDSSDFSLWFEPSLERRRYFFRHEVMRACKRLDKRRNGKTLALCLSGGVDSEIIALALNHLGIPFEMYFLDNWGRNRATYEQWVRPLGEKLNKKVEVVSLERDYFLKQYSKQVFAQIGCEYPTYLMMTYLFQKIPADRFIVTGDGDLDRVGELYEYLGSQHPIAPGTPGLHLPFATNSIAHDLWAALHQRAGEYYFFNSTPELVASVVTDPRFKVNYPFSHTKAVIANAFPEIKSRAKTTNWDTPEAWRENSSLRILLQREARQLPGYGSWLRGTGVAVQVDRIFVS